MTPYSVKQQRRHVPPRTPCENNNGFLQILDVNMGPNSVNQHSGDTCHSEDRVRKRFAIRVLDVNVLPHS
eukprot:4567866-Pyramimonas_sp.AAC.1